MYFNALLKHKKNDIKKDDYIIPWERIIRSVQQPMYLTTYICTIIYRVFL